MFFNHIHIERELKAQMEKFHELTGFYPDFIDGHNHCHVANPVIAMTFAGVCNRWYPSVIRCRLPIQPFINPQTKSKKPKNLDHFHELVHNCALSSLLEFEKCFSVLPKFCGMNLLGEELNAENLQHSLNYYTNQTEPHQIINNPHYFELMCHPGYKNQGLSGGCDKKGKCQDDFAKSEDREIEMKNLQQISEFVCSTEQVLVQE